MAYPYFCCDTIDDLMRLVIKELLASGTQIDPTKGRCRELTGVLLELSNPRARLSRSETRGKPFSCLGELCWYLAKSNDLAFIKYYLPKYKEYADANEIIGGYGPRLFEWKGQNQVENIIDLLKKRKTSRQAVIQLFDAEDLAQDHKSIPCTTTIQFLVRNDRLDLFVNMRSNDVYWGLPHDIFVFTMLQEIMARTISVKLGNYKHAVGSLHLYDINESEAKQYMDEGWQSTEKPMSPMPFGNPWDAIDILLQAELAERNGNSLDPKKLMTIDPYWADLIRLLQIFRYSKKNDFREIAQINNTMHSDIYQPFIEKKLSDCKRRSRRKKS